jgi:arylsulfatase A-like enzyme
MLAGHGGDAVTWLSAALDGWQTSSAFSRTPIPAVQQFVDTASIAADYGQSWKPLLPADRYLDPDEGEGEAPPAGWKQAFPHVLSGEGDKPDMVFLNQWQHSPFADAYLGRFAAALVEAMALGARDGTDVLGISFSSPDFVGHAFGPRSREVQDIYARLDQTLGTLFERLDTLVGRNRYLVAFTSDHGVAVRPEERGRPGPEGGRLNLPMVRDAIDRVAQAAAGPGKYLVRGSAATNDLYFEPGMYDRLRTRPGALGSVIDRLQEEPGIAGVFRSEQLSAATSAPDALLRAAALSYVPERSGELVLALAPGWMYAPGGTSHGTANAYDQQVPMFFMGEGIRAGEYPEAATPADIAPTLAALSGIAMPQAEGRVLHSALAARSPESTGRSTSDGTRPNPAAPPSAAAKDR